MTKNKLSKSSKKSYWPLEKRKKVEQIRSGFYSFEQAREKYILPKRKLRKWNRWYFKVRLLRHFKAKPLPIMKKANQQVQELKSSYWKPKHLMGSCSLKIRF